MQRNTVYIIAEKSRGIFLGTAQGIAIFSSNDFLSNTKAYCFTSLEAAMEFVYSNMPIISNSVEYLRVERNYGGDYADIVDIIKSGHKEYIRDMFLNIPTSETIH